MNASNTMNTRTTIARRLLLSAGQMLLCLAGSMLGFQLGQPPGPQPPIPQQPQDISAHKVLLQNADGQIVASISKGNLLFSRAGQAVPAESMSYNADSRWACGFGFLGGFSIGASLAFYSGSGPSPTPDCVGQILLFSSGESDHDLWMRPGCQPGYLHVDVHHGGSMIESTKSPY